METELKFQVPAPRRQALRHAVATPGVRRTRLQAIYFDTADRRLAAAGLALRLRKEGRVWVQTLKGRGDGLMQRLEHEVALEAQRGVPALDVQRHAGTSVGRALADVLAGPADAATALQAWYRTDIERLHRRVRHAGASIEIAYDHGRLVAGEAMLAVDEIEFELVSGAPAALPALARRWAERHGLWWDSRTKSERGLRLALGLHSVPATRAAPVGWTADSTLAHVWQAALQAALAQTLANAAEIAEGLGGPEHLHQLRVALRRLRTVLRLFAPWAGLEDEAQALDEAWAGPFGQLGTLRDADVLASWLRPRLRAAGAPDIDLPPLPAGVDAGALARGPEFTALLLRTLTLAVSAQPPRAVPEPAGLADAARSLLRDSWRQVRAGATTFADDDAQTRHRTRRRLKRFRYAFEMLLPLYPPKAARRLRAALARALDALGAGADLDMAAAACRRQAEVDPRAWFAVGWIEAQQAPAEAAAAVALAGLHRAPRVWRRR